MTNKISIIAILLFLPFSIAFAQDSNAQKILGCWKLKKMSFSEPDENSAAIRASALNTLVCFMPEERFTTQKGKEPLLQGEYHLSADGKTLFQKRNINDDGSDEDAEILSIDDKQFVIKALDVTLYFER